MEESHSLYDITVDVVNKPSIFVFLHKTAKIMAFDDDSDRKSFKIEIIPYEYDQAGQLLTVA
jgi:hypothetical protein